MIASLPMYDHPAVRGATSRLWTAIRDHLGRGPAELYWPDDLVAAWTSPDLLLSQTCGYPYRTRLRDRVQLVATPIHALSGVPAGHYTSAIVVRCNDTRRSLAEFKTATLARNSALSQSGWAAPEAEAAGLGFTFQGCTLDSGAHIASARMVAEGAADLAAIDAVTWEILRRHDTVATALRVLAQTRPTPALPYITAKGRDPAPLRAALAAAITSLTQEDRDDLVLTGICDIPEQSYCAVWTPPLAS